MAPTAYEIAKAGGRHAGLVRRYEGEATRQVEKAVASLERRISEHLDKIARPEDHLPVGVGARQIRHLVDAYWPREIAGYRSQIEVLRGILKESGNGP